MSSARRREAEHILKICGGYHLEAYQLIERQLQRAIQRAQVLVAVSCGMVALTAISGRAVAQSGNTARLCIVGAVGAFLVASGVAVWGVLRLRWLSKEIDDEPVVTLLRTLEVRDRKVISLRAAHWIFMIAFALYVTAVGQYLLAP
jgi:hypothetical protein